MLLVNVGVISIVFLCGDFVGTFQLPFYRANYPCDSRKLKDLFILYIRH